MNAMTQQEKPRGADADPRWRAVLNRDASADNEFVYAVKTTGIYCRPSCPSRMARPENVTFFASCEDAQVAGYRACRRCTPDAVSLREKNAPVETRDWDRIAADLSSYGCAVIEKLLTPEECQEIACLYPHEEHFRSHVRMARHGFGKGEYRYFKYPLPARLGGLRAALFPHLAAVANDWNARMGLDRRYPTSHAHYLELCHDAGQTRPTPLLLQYGAGDFNCLHQDLYGDLVFPLQATILLSKPGRDFTGGEFVLTEQRPRMQSRVEVVALDQGDAVIFAVQNRPVKGAKGTYRVNLRHGVSRLHSGQRHTVGIIFHDAK